MKNYFRLFFIPLLTAILIVSSISSVSAQQFMLIDKTFTWSETTGGDGCYGYHFFTDMGQATTTNWKSPYDYQNGLFYFRYEIISQPELPGGGYEPFGISFCIWADRNYEPGLWKENCSNITWFTGPGSTIEISENPSAWWTKNGGIDWSALDKLWRFGNPFWVAGGCPLASANCTCADPSIWTNERTKYLPLNLRLTIVAVAQGQSFLGWDYYLNGGSPSLRQPTPTYGIDYYNERTNKVVPSTDEYAYNSSMSGAVSGSGSVLYLTPGQDVYFREKANGDTLASYVQHLTVPSRPAAPNFTWDQANQRTSYVVSSDYEYSTSADMSGAVSGTGSYVSIAAGSTKYFRKKANGSAFKSNIQTLQGVAGTSIGPEFVIINETIDYPNSTDDNGFYFFYYNSSMPTNWTSPYDYYNGQIYVRYEIISQATSTPAGIQFGIWQKLPVETGHLYESMGDILTLNGPGSVVTYNSSPNTYWALDGGVDYTQMDKVWHFGINPWKIVSAGEKYQIRQENASVWAERFTYWFPMKVKVTVVAVASGYTFSGWGNYLTTKAPTPTYGIDYTNELSDKVVPTTDEYSANSNMSGAVSGTGQKITLTPGQNKYFRTKAQGSVTASDIQTVNVPARPANPSFAIDYTAENTSIAVSSDYEYASSADMSSASSGTGVKVNVTPGSNLYFRKKATAGSFKSGVQTLTVANRPAAPLFTIDYANERTAEAVSSSYAYSANADMSSSVTGTGDKPAITPGTSKYFRKLATAGEFASSIQVLTAPARPATPSFAIDYINENTSTVVPSDVEYADNVSMTGAASGTGSKVSLVPGVNRYFRKKATASNFRSAVQTLAVPARPAAPAFTIDYAGETIAENVSTDFEYSTNASMSGATTGNGSKPAVVPGTNLYFKGKASATQFASLIQTLVVGIRPASPSYTINYTAETTNEPVSAGDEYASTSTMTGAVSGSGSPVALVPGTTLYFRSKATSSIFSSDKQKMVVPARPTIDAGIGDTVTTQYFLIAINLQNDDGFTIDDIAKANCTLTEMGALIFKVEPVEQGDVTLKVNTNAVTGGNFASDELKTYYKPFGPSGFDSYDISGDLILYPSPVKDVLEISLQREQNIPMHIILMDIYGRQVSTCELQSGSASIDCSNLPRGLYLIKCIVSGQEVITQKIVKE
jgi:hypothetical protein